jgi:hypothetical protein
MPWPSFKSAWSHPAKVSKGGILEGASAHSSFQAATVWPRLVYRGSWETYVRRLLRVSSSGGNGFNQFNGEFMPSPASVTSNADAERRDSNETCVVWGCDPLSAVRRTRSGALWRATPPFVNIRKATWVISWHAALWRLMVRAL